MKTRGTLLVALAAFACAAPLSSQDLLEGNTPSDEVSKVAEQLKSESAALREAAEKKLSELDKDCLEALKSQAVKAKDAGDTDLALKLDGAVKRIEAANAVAEACDESAEGEWIETGGMKLRIIPMGPPGSSMTSRVVESDGEKRTVVETRDSKTTTLKRETADGEIEYEVKDADGVVLESGRVASEAELQDKHPELYKTWSEDGEVNIWETQELIPEELRQQLEQLEQLDEEMQKAREQAERELQELDKRFADMLRRALERHGGLIPEGAGSDDSGKGAAPEPKPGEEDF